MSTEYREGRVRTRCDICRKLVGVMGTVYPVHDSSSRATIECCSRKCSDTYWVRYQLGLSPCSNTGVAFDLGALEEGEFEYSPEEARRINSLEMWGEK